jgi:hypothetical protein
MATEQNTGNTTAPTQFLHAGNETYDISSLRSAISLAISIDRLYRHALD